MFTNLMISLCSWFIYIFIQAPLPVNINAKNKNDLRPIDIAVVYGSWDIYKFLVDEGATFTANTIIACCSDDRYECINSWTKRIRSLCSCEKACSKTKKRILIDLYERYNSAFITFLNINSISKLFLINQQNCYINIIIMYVKYYTKKYTFYDTLNLFGKLITVIML